MTIEVLGSGCRKCLNLYESVKAAVAETGVDATVDKTTDLLRIAAYGVQSTPALVIDGKVVATGRIPSKDDVVRLILARTKA